MTISRALSGYEKIFISTNELVQFSVNLCHPRYVSSTVDLLQRAITGFHLRTEGSQLIYDNSPLSVSALPSSITNPRTAATWIDQNLRLPFTTRLASIAANDTTVAVSVSHLCADGAFFTRLLDSIIAQRIENSPVFPTPIEQVFARELSDPTLSVSQHISDIPRIATVPFSRSVPSLPDSVRCGYFVDESPFSEFIHTAKPGSTESLWTAMTLGFASFSGTLDRVGCSTLLNLRPYMNPSDVNLSIGNNFVCLCIIPKKFNPKMTVAQMAAEMRKDLTEKRKAKAYFPSLKASLAGFVVPDNRTALAELSHLGNLRITEPVHDMWIQQTMRSKEIQGLMSLITWTTSGDVPSKLIARLQYCPTVMTEKDAKIVFELIVHGLKKIPDDVTVQDAFDELQSVKRRLLRSPFD
jgi:hypothetical protein